METRRRHHQSRGVAAIAVAGVLTAWALACAARAAEEAYIPLSQLNPTALAVGTPIITEGIYAGRIEGTVALRGSSVLFIMAPGVEKTVRFGDLSDATILRLQGSIAYEKDSRTYYVSVSGITETIDARDRIVKAVNDPQATPAKLLDAGNWARTHAVEYNDERLETLAQAAYLRALKLGDLELKPDDYEGCFALGEESYKLLQRPSLREYYVREGIDAFILAKGSRSPDTYYEASKLAGKLLPGGTLSDQLLEDGFTREVGLSDDEGTPDYYALAEKARQVLGAGMQYYRFLAKGLDAERGKVAPGDYSALYGLARKAKEIYPEYPSYRTLVWDAVAMEKSSMDVRDAQAWVRLGNRILYFLDDKYQAGLCFKEAVHLDATIPEAREKLRQLGFVYYQGNWWRSSQQLGRSELFRRAKELEDRTAEGQITVGMSREQLLRARGNPDTVSFAGGGWGVTSQWVYRAGDKLIYVDLLANTVVSKGEAEPDKWPIATP